MKNLSLVFLFTGCLSLFAAELTLLPKSRPFRLTFSDPREIRMALGVVNENRIEASIGNYFSIFQIHDKFWKFVFGLEGAGYFTMRQTEKRFPLESADGLIGVYTEGATGPWQLQLRYTHISAHLADGSAKRPIAYSRESLALRLGTTPVEEIHLYSGVAMLTHTIPELPPISFQLGGSYFLQTGSKSLIPFTATDIKWRRETSFDPSLSFQLGLALNDPPEAYRSFRIYYSYYTGADPRGQFFYEGYTAHSIGLEMQI